MKNEFQLLDALDEDVLHDEATEEPSYDLYYKNNETGDFGFYGLSTPSKEEAIEAAKECKAEKPHCDYFVMTDIDDCIFSTKSQNKAMKQLGETVKIVPDHKTSLDLLNHDLGEKINPELYKPFGHDSYDSGYIHEPEMPDWWYDPEEDEPSMLPPDADDEDYDDDFDFELEEDYKQGGERTFTPDEPEYAKIKAVADKLNSMDLVSKWDHKTPYEFSVEDVYLDYGSRWMWTTIVATLQGGGDSHQVLSPNEWLDIVNGTVSADVMANKMLVDEYAQFEKSKKSELEEAKKVGLVAAAKRALAKACDKLKNGSPEEIYNRALAMASRSEYPFVKDNLIAKKDAAIEFIVKRQEAESFDECKTLKESELDTDRYEWIRKGQGLTESARGYALTYNFGDDEYDYSCSWAEALDIIKSELSTQDIIDMIDDPDFDPERHDLDDFILSNLEVFDDLLHDALKSDARAQYELDKDYAREFNSSRRYNEEVDPDEEFDHTVYGFTKMINQATSKEELDDIAQAVNNMELPQETVDRIVKAIYAKTREVKRSLGEAAEKVYTIVRSQNGRERETSGTLEELIQHFSYTLQNGYSWQGARKGNHKIDRHPKTISALIKNLNWAADNAAANGYSGTSYSLAQEQKECLTERLADIKNVDTEHYVVGKKGMWFAKDKSESELLTKAYCSEDEGKTWHVCYLEKKTDAPSGRTQAGKAFFRTPKLSKGRVSIGRNVLTWYANKGPHEVDYSLEIDHVNGNFTDDHLSNLEPVTPSENKKRRKAQKSVQEDILDPYCNDEEKRGELPAPEEEKQEALNESLADVLAQIHLGDEIDDKVVGDWEINAWTAPSGYYIVQLDNEKLGKHYHLGDNESQGELEMKLKRLVNSHKELVEKASPDGYAPKQTGKAYKVFRVKNGKLYPPMVANAGGADTPIGVWLDAEEGEFAGVSKTGRPQVKSTGSGTLAYRPGWHLGDVPRAPQFDRKNKETGEMEFPADFVWAECDYAMDINYQDEADERGYMRTKVDSEGNVITTKSDKYQHSLAGLPKLPKDGYYKYRTNPRPDTVPWVITGQMKVNRLLSDAEVNEILQSKGIAPIHRQGGDKTLAELGLHESLSVKEDLASTIQSIHDKDEYLWNLHDTDYSWLYDEVKAYLEDGEDLDAPGQVDLIAKAIRRMPVNKQKAIYQKLIAPLQGKRYPVDPEELTEAQKVIKKYKEQQKKLSEGLSRDEMIAELKKLGKGYYKFDTKSDKQLSMILQKELSRPKKHVQTIDVPGAQFCPECHTQLADNGECPKCSGNMTEAFEDEYNDCYVEFRDGKPFMAYTSLKYAKDGVFWDRFADAQNGEGYNHKYEIKYLKDGEYSLPESLQEDTKDTLLVPEDEKKESLKEGKIDIIKNLEDSGFEIYHRDELEPELDEEIIDYMAEEGLDILLSHPSMARFWYFRDLDSMIKYFENGGQVSVDQHAQVLGE